MTKRKKKFKLKIKRIITLLALITIAITVLINYKEIKIFLLSKKTHYKEETIEVFMEKNIYEKIKDKKYSKVLEETINTEYFNNEYINDYLEIDYKEKENYIEKINGLLNLGYQSKEINELYNKLSDNSIQVILNNEYVKDILNIINIPYFEEDKLNRYIKYEEKNKKSIEDTITYVNIGLDNKYYTNVISLDKEESSITAIVNKYHSLSKNYVPNDLQNVKYGKGELRKVAKEAFDKMCDAARKDKIYIAGGSGYRSYTYQQTIYNNYIARDGFNKAETYSARPGYSEHQTGLAMDVVNEYGEYISETDKEYTWLINNSYKYGFILRYPKGKDTLTGYMYEEWHYRYLGIDIATDIYNEGLTYDEYVARNLLKK